MHSPSLGPEEQIYVWELMTKLWEVATEKAGDVRGNFEIMTFGTQKGHGSSVSLIPHRLNRFHFEIATRTQCIK